VPASVKHRSIYPREKGTSLLRVTIPAFA